MTLSFESSAEDRPDVARYRVLIVPGASPDASMLLIHTLDVRATDQPSSALSPNGTDRELSDMASTVPGAQTGVPTTRRRTLRT